MHRWIPWFSTLLLVGGLALPAEAQHGRGRGHGRQAADDPNARARSLFAEGVQLEEEGLHEQAEARFREALALRDAPAIRYNLASVLFEENEYPEAAALLDSILADSGAPEDLRQHATELRGQIDQRAGRLHIDLHTSGASVAVDGFVISDLSSDIPIAPGEHTVTATHEGAEIARGSVTAVAGERHVLGLGASHAEPVDEERPEEEPLPVVAAGGSVLEEWWFWALIGGGIAIGVGVGVGVGVASSGVEPPLSGNFQPGILRF